MKTFFLASLLAAAVSASLLQEHAEKFQDFKRIHGKSYLNQVEEIKRFSIFRDNLRAIEEHNDLYEQGLVTYKQKITQFSDKTQEEFKASLGLQIKPTLMKTTKYVKTGVAVPDSVDWRKKGQVTAVKNQGEGCLSCWAFSLTGATEAAYFRKSGKLVPLSEQQLVDCTKDVNIGCMGGLLKETFPYIQKNGLQSEESYPYEEMDGLCRYNSSEVVSKTSSFVAIPTGDEDALLEAVATVGPVSVAINSYSLGHYASGIFHDPDCALYSPNHAVLVVGYGSENEKDYWIVKNSYGVLWGDEGYLKLQRGVNECNITLDTVYPVID